MDTCIDLPSCKTQKSFQDIFAQHVEKMSRTRKTGTNIPPCLDLQKIQMDYVEEDISPTVISQVAMYTNDTWFEIKIDILTDTFKEIKQVRAYSGQSLVGNMGGYLGLFLGYALLGVPSLVLAAWSNVKKLCRKHNEPKYNKSDPKNVDVRNNSTLNASGCIPWYCNTQMIETKMENDQRYRELKAEIEMIKTGIENDQRYRELKAEIEMMKLRENMINKQ